MELSVHLKEPTWINDKVKGEYFKSPSKMKETEQKDCDIDGFFIIY